MRRHEHDDRIDRDHPIATGRDDQGRVDDDRPEGVREHVAQDDAGITGAARLRGLNVFLLAQREEDTADDTGDPRPQQQRQDHADLERIAVPEERGRGQEHREARQREDQVGETHQQVIEPPAGVARDQADRYADRHDHEHRDEPDDERDATQSDVLSPKMTRLR